MKKQKKRIEELLVDNKSSKVNKRRMRFIESYVHVIEQTAGYGKTLRDFYKKPSVAKQDAYEYYKACLKMHHGILGTVVNGSMTSFSYGYLVYGKGVGKKEADRFYLMYETKSYSYEIEFPSEYIYIWFHQYVAIRGQIISCLHDSTGYEIELE